ncbi:MAG: hypothetical protein QOD71_355 [Thermoleophilaceae bacterium]|nr:hypothetical protein [Thermoleophilaceae bacterium]
MTGISPLNLLHPTGRVDRILVLGDHCPPSLVPAAATRATEAADLALIAPSPGELRKTGWIERAARVAARALDRHGFAYALLPRGSRAEANRRLCQAGLVLEPPLAQFPGGGFPRYLLPLEAAAWRHALTHQIDANPQARRALLAARALPFGSSLLVHALPSVGIVARPPGAEPLAAWVADLGGEARPTAQAVVATSWRGPRGPIVLHCFGPGEAEPWGVAKVAEESEAEGRALDELGQPARAAGARVPRVLAKGRVAGRPVLVETVVSGRPAADALTRSPGRYAEVIGAIADWQRRWNLQTVVSGSRLEQEVLGPATELAGTLPDTYLAWLTARVEALPGSARLLVARHNDLTMWNVRLDRKGAIGVLDWAEADAAGLPLTDFFYAVVDGAAACDGYRDRLNAARSCFGAGGARADRVAALQERLRESLRLSPEALELSFHACWLRHACNELRTSNSSDGSFMAIARWLARRATEEAA